MRCYITNKIIFGCLEIWNFYVRVPRFYCLCYHQNVSSCPKFERNWHEFKFFRQGTNPGSVFVFRFYTRKWRVLIWGEVHCGDFVRNFERKSIEFGTFVDCHSEFIANFSTFQWMNYKTFCWFNGIITIVPPPLKYFCKPRNILKLLILISKPFTVLNCTEEGQRVHLIRTGKADNVQSRWRMFIIIFFSERNFCCFPET